MQAAQQRIYLVRHGETEWSASHRHTGLSDVPLIAHGEQQAHELNTRLREETFAQIFSSPLQRAHRTCVLAGYEDGCILDPDLYEWDYGDYEGRTTAAIQRDVPGWNVFTHPCPNGESLADVQQRADRFIDRIRSVPGNVLAFSSGHIIRVITARWLGLEPQAGRFFAASTATINVLGFEHNLKEPVIHAWSK